MIRRAKNLIVHRILGVRDTPRRIAWGVFLGTIVAWTPTLGFQIMIYVAIATLLRANKVAGIPILFISNPVTAVPLYWSCWKVGDFLVNGGEGATPEAQLEMQERLSSSEEAAAETDWWNDLLTAEFWEQLGQTLWDMGSELWVGSLVIGFTMAIPMYFVTLLGVRAFRKARGLPG